MSPELTARLAAWLDETSNEVTLARVFDQGWAVICEEGTQALGASLEQAMDEFLRGLGA